MRIIKLSNPRKGFSVQCCMCLKMIEQKNALVDIDGEPFKSYYHPACLPVPIEGDYANAKLLFLQQWTFEGIQTIDIRKLAGSKP